MDYLQRTLQYMEGKTPSCSRRFRGVSKELRDGVSLFLRQLREVVKRVPPSIDGVMRRLYDNDEWERICAVSRRLKAYSD